MSGASARSDSGKNVTDLLRENRSLIVKYLMRFKSCSRSELAQHTGLTQASVTKIVNSLIDLGIVQEGALVKGAKGRRKIMVSLKGDKIRIIGIKLARRSFSIGVFDISGELFESKKYPISTDIKPDLVIDTMINKIAEFQSQYENVIAVGVAVPGPYLRYEGRISKMTEYAGWENFNIVQAFENRLSIPVFIEHDANAGALAEWWFGDIQPRGLVFLLASEGIGAGIIHDGKLLLGTDGVAGEVGHMSIAFNGRKCHCAEGSRGCLEQYCSALSFIRDVMEELPDHPESKLSPFLTQGQLRAGDVFDAAEAGDEFSIKMVDQVAMYLGIGVANLVNIYNPGTVIISDIMALGGQRLLNGVRKTVRARVFPQLFDRLEIRLSDLPYDPILYGAMATAADRFLDNPVGILQ